MDDRDFFDKIALTWDENEILSTPEKVREILGLINLSPGNKVLDLGTGTGVLLPYIAEFVGQGGSITAVDYSVEMLKIAKRKYSDLVPKPNFLQLDFENENIPGEYDRIILYCVYPHLHTPLETLKWLRKVNLNKGGEIIIAFPSGPEFINNIHRERHSHSDLLPSATSLAAFFNNEGLNASVISETDNSYIISIKAL